MDNTLIFATNNLHKLEEIRLILPDFRILGLKDIGLYQEIAETGATLEENALIKASYLYDKTGLSSLSEDTGLEVFCLNLAPGVHTARYAGDSKNPALNMDKLLGEMLGKEDRKARFRTVIAYVTNDGVQYFEGLVNGEIATLKSGNKGFGYDPIFIPDGHEKTFADLDANIKNKISHRANAVNKLIDFLKIEK
ncbi:MAG: RdgB/HAM1 family non-canonical purine NTP pyrophosphatase [Saprospiraceae bacterium]|nr:RdgB/HAM1 family non-canonical purine NTP pyrophosphatase [Saprospiraceae bacterium]